MAFSPSGLLLGQVGHRVAVYSVSRRKTTIRSEWHYPHPARIAFSPSDHWFAVRSTTGAMVVADTSDGQPRARLVPPSDIADDSPLLSGPTNEHLIEACSSGTLRVRNIAGLAVEYLEQHPDFMLAAASSADRRLWALAFNRKQGTAPQQPACRIELRTWPFTTGPRHVVGECSGVVHALALSPDGGRLAVLHHTANRRELALSIMGVASGVVSSQATSTAWATHHGFAWSPDGALVVVGTHEGHALIDAATLTPLGHLGGAYASDATFSPDGRLLALGFWAHGLVLPTSKAREWFADLHPGSVARAV